MANNNNGNQFRDDEIVVLTEKRDRKLVKSIHPKIGGRLRLAHEQNQQISITTEVIRYDESVAVVRAVTTTMRRTFPGTGMASVERDHAIASAIGNIRFIARRPILRKEWKHSQRVFPGISWPTGLRAIRFDGERN